MDSAITAFLITLGIVGGLLSPFILIMVVTLISNMFKAMTQAMLLKTEEIKRKMPFDEVEANVNPMTHVTTARFIRDGETIWEGAVTRNDALGGKQ